MNKPASELIALADRMAAASECSSYEGRYNLGFVSAGERDLIVDALRTAANQSGSERAGVDALLPKRPFAFAVRRAPENGEDQWRLFMDENEARSEAEQLDGDYEGLYRVGDRRAAVDALTVTAQVASAVRVWLECPAEKRPSAQALGMRVADIATASGHLDVQQPAADVVMTPPEWIWWGEVDGKDVVTFGRWPKRGAQWRYKLADVQPTEHDHEDAKEYDTMLATGVIPRSLQHRFEALATPPTESNAIMTDDQIKYMVDRFLMWKLPEHFNPDCGISFDLKYRDAHSPIGTNLFDAVQATEMVRHMLDGMPTHGKPDGAVRTDGGVESDDERLERLAREDSYRDGQIEEYKPGQPEDGTVREALDDMLGAFAEGVCWSPEQRAAYEKAALALQNSDLHSPKIAAAETSPGDAYREVIDEALIVRHLGVAKGNAKAELNQILDWDVAAALDPAVSGRKA